MKRTLLSLMFLVASLASFAYDFEVDGIYYNILSEEELTCEVAASPSSNQYTGMVVVPSMVSYGEKTYTVTSIRKYAFYNCYDLTSITIPNSVTSIGGGAFSGCSALTSITIPTSVTSIGEKAFYNCYDLTSITIPNSVTSIGEDAFADCSSLPVIDGLRYADTYLVMAIDKSLSTYTIKEGTRFIGRQAFFECSALTSITIPNSVTSIGKRAFEGCSSLTSITIPNSVTNIKDNTFYQCSKLTSITIPNSVTSIGGGAFAGCSALTSITIPTSVTSIEDYTFYRCRELTSITIPNSVTSIGRYAFGDCSALPSITIPNSVTSIGGDAFAGCSALTSITIPTSVTSIGEKAFYNCYDLTSITIPNSVTSIGDYSFQGCSGLTSITIPNSVTRIGNNAFYGCSSLPVEDGIRYADCYVVEATDKSNEYKLKENTRFIGEGAFKGCSNLRKIEIPKSLIRIGNNAFYGCSVLSSLTIKALTPPVCGSNALGDINKAACQLYVPYGTTADYQAADQWRDFIIFNELEKETEEDPELEKPTITLEDGLLHIRSNVKNAKRYYEITAGDVQDGAASGDVELQLTGTYNIIAYIMTTEGKKSADTTATLVWATPSMDGDGIMNMQMQKALLLRSVGGSIAVEGLEEGEVVELYNVSGMLLDKVKAAAITETLGNALQKGQTYIIKVGDRSVKYQY